MKNKIHNANLIGIGVYAPRSYSQESLLELCDTEHSDFARGVSRNSAIDTRSFSTNPREFLNADLATRSRYHLETATQMAHQALLKASAHASLARLDAVIAVTSTGFLQPGLAQVLGTRHGVGHATAQRFNLVGDGCYGALPALQLAQSLIASGICETVALVCSEANLALLDAESVDPSYVLPRVLFGEGAAALIFSRNPVEGLSAPRVVDTGNLMIAGTGDKVGVQLGNSWTCQIAKDVPQVGERAIPEMVRGFLARRGLKPDDIQHWAFHAGGRKVLNALERAFALSREQMFPSAEVLRTNGNLSSASALFSLELLMSRQAPRAGELGLIVAIGPGMITGACLLEW